MCLAVPARVTELHGGDMARVDMDGVAIDVNIALVDEVHVDDYVVVHVGYALSKLDPDEAERTLNALREATVLRTRA